MSLATYQALPAVQPLPTPMYPALATRPKIPKVPAFSRQQQRRKLLKTRSLAFPRQNTMKNSVLLDVLLQDVATLASQADMLKNKATSFVFFTVLASVAASLVSPHAFDEKVTEVLIPTAASIIAVCTTAAEFKGKDATADAKEVAAVGLARAAQAEAYLAASERAKAIIPAMVGVSAGGAVSCLVFPILTAAGVAVSPALIAACPVVSIAAAAWSAVAKANTMEKGNLALEKVDPDAIQGRSAKRKPIERMKELFLAVVPPTLIAFFLPGDLAFRCVIASAAAAAVVAKDLAEAETVVSEVTLKVSKISKAAAQADVFANRAVAESSVLPFTSAITLAATALSAAFVEVEPAVASLMPAFGAVASGLGTVAAQRAEQDCSSTRLAFKDNDLRKTSLFQNTMPELFKGMLISSAEYTGQWVQWLAKQGNQKAALDAEKQRKQNLARKDSTGTDAMLPLAG
mmetsp:Transcript_21757/g.43670  ORF Transcript_21757/g.43670 Transcript_21757/m.43670 type:complete len:460 (-) Transcript_21757:239-1618(-)|eukprot:CAMPEP_0167787590 /NCGR_PEP_ID=MMETSP0111_2-20121227/9525_1 /TAXON_ID=91324 /ORGANISM="Lotharella globosa, Strain CCCM811" /LENGTH=459 /DNA_ID=CAMNT_0007679285 /DNA_START=135 /DNA_END=1514 /DNA_ORIENTATION=-